MEKRLEILKETLRFQWGELAERLGISRSMLDQVRKGTRVPGPKLVRAIESAEIDAGIVLPKTPGRSRDRPEKQGENDQFGPGASTETDGSSVPAPGNLTPEQIQSLETRLAALEHGVAEILMLLKRMKR